MTAALPTSILAGDRLSGDDFTAMLAISISESAAWTPVTPGWIASAGTPAIGNGSLTARYRLIGKTLDWQVNLTAGTTTTYGTAGASWGFTLPLGLMTAADATFPYQMDDTGVTSYGGIGVIGAGLTFTTMIKPAGSGVLVNNSPFTFGNTDVLRFTARIEVV